MTLVSQKYANIIRAVSGTVTVEVNDCVLEVTTASVAATINLQAFTPSAWSTQYKLYVVDASANAGTNNITIIPPAGYTINGQSSAIINTNGGSAIVRIVDNGKYITQLSNFSSTSLPMPFMYNKKLLQTALTNYIPVISAGTYSVVSGQQITGFDTTVASNLTGWDATTGVWTVPSTGYYSLNAKLITRLLSTNKNSIIAGDGNGWMTTQEYPSGVGIVSIAIVVEQGQRVVCADKQVVQSSNISDINICCTQNVFGLTAGDLVSVYVLNKTNRDMYGMAAVVGQPDCIIDFSITKIS